VLGIGINVVGTLSGNLIVSGTIIFLLLVFLIQTNTGIIRYFFENMSRERVLGTRARFRDFSVGGGVSVKRLDRRPVGVVPIMDLRF
jgi:hypothetical protein